MQGMHLDWIKKTKEFRARLEKFKCERNIR